MRPARIEPATFGFEVRERQLLLSIIGCYLLLYGSIVSRTDVVGVYLNPPDKAVVFCVDEKSQVQTLDRTQPGLTILEKVNRCKGVIEAVHCLLFRSLRMNLVVFPHPHFIDSKLPHTRG